jgi:hypothetical protein
MGLRCGRFGRHAVLMDAGCVIVNLSRCELVGNQADGLVSSRTLR